LFTAQRSAFEQINIIDKEYAHFEKTGEDLLKGQSRFSRFTEFLNWVSASCFVIGVVFLCLFCLQEPSPEQGFGSAIHRSLERGKPVRPSHSHNHQRARKMSEPESKSTPKVSFANDGPLIPKSAVVPSFTQAKHQNPNSMSKANNSDLDEAGCVIPANTARPPQRGPGDAQAGSRIPSKLPPGPKTGT